MRSSSFILCAAVCMTMAASALSTTPALAHGSKLIDSTGQPAVWNMTWYTTEGCRTRISMPVYQIQDGVCYSEAYTPNKGPYLSFILHGDLATGEFNATAYAWENCRAPESFPMLGLLSSCSFNGAWEYSFIVQPFDSQADTAVERL